MADQGEATQDTRGVNPTPWSVTSDEDGYTILDADGARVAKSIADEMTANTIVRAVNSYRPRRFL